MPVLLLGAALAFTYRSEAKNRGLDEGKSKATLVAESGIEPVLDGRPLTEGLSPTEDTSLHKLVNLTAREGQILRLRLRDLNSKVVFSDDGSGFADAPDDEALDAAKGKTVGLLTHLNTDTNDSGPQGVAAVEVYVPLSNSEGEADRRARVVSPVRPDQRRRQRRAVEPVPQPRARVGRAVRRAVHHLAVRQPRLRRQVAINAFMAEHDTLTNLPEPHAVPPTGRRRCATPH